MTIGIYRIENIKNGKFYIGSSVDLEARWKKHQRELSRGIHHSQKLQRAYNKYGKSAFQFFTLEESTVAHLIHREQYYIDLMNPVDHGYNVSPSAFNPMLNRRHTEETRRRMSESAKGIKPTQEARAKMRESRLAYVNANPPFKHSEDSRKKMSQAFIGKSLSSDHRAKLSASHKGKQVSEETKMKLRVASTGYKHTEEAKEKMRAARYKRIRMEERGG